MESDYGQLNSDLQGDDDDYTYNHYQQLVEQSETIDLAGEIQNLTDEQYYQLEEVSSTQPKKKQKKTNETNSSELGVDTQSAPVRRNGQNYQNGNNGNNGKQHSKRGKKKKQDNSIESFYGILMNWELSKVLLDDRRALGLSRLDPLPATFGNKIQYYTFYGQVAIEESRVSILNGIRSPEGYAPFRYEKVVTESDTAHLGLIEFHKQGNDMTYPGWIFEFSLSDGIRFLGCIAQSTSTSKIKRQDSVFIWAASNEIRRYKASLHNGSTLKVKCIGSVISYQRMFVTCLDRPTPFFLEKLFGGKQSSHIKFTDEEDTNGSLLDESITATEGEDSNGSKRSTDTGGLNPAQFDALVDCLKSVAYEKGIVKLIHGPPGCGKTHFLVKLLYNLLLLGKRVLVCAPSNKAVCVALEQFLRYFNENRPDKGDLVSVDNKSSEVPSSPSPPEEEEPDEPPSPTGETETAVEEESFPVEGSSTVTPIITEAEEMGDSRHGDHNLNLFQFTLIGVEEKIGICSTPASYTFVQREEYIPPATALTEGDLCSLLLTGIGQEFSHPHPSHPSLPGTILPSYLLDSIASVLQPTAAMDLFLYNLPDKLLYIFHNLIHVLKVIKAIIGIAVKREVTANISHPPDEQWSDLLHLLQVLLDQLHHESNRVMAFITSFLSGGQLKDKITRYDNRIYRQFDQLIRGYIPSFVGTPSCGCDSAKAALLTEILEDIIDQYMLIYNQLLEGSDVIMNDVIYTSQVVFSTLTTTGTSLVRRNIGEIDILLCDEAAQSLEAELIIPFGLHPKNLILIGDPQQLPATVLSHPLQRAGLGISTMQRLQSHLSYPSKLLSIQYRMHPEISSFPNREFYDGRLCNSSHVIEREAILFHPTALESLPEFLHHYTFVDIQGKEEYGNPYHRRKVGNASQDGSNTGSVYNLTEATWIACFLRTLIDTGHFRTAHASLFSQICIITFYSSQVQCIRKELAQRQLSAIRVMTVDSFQGSECDFVLLSFVRCNDKRNIGFVKDYQRLNVALTRAKYLLVCVGSYQTFQNAMLDQFKAVNRAKEGKDSTATVVKNVWPSNPTSGSWANCKPTVEAILPNAPTWGKTVSATEWKAKDTSDYEAESSNSYSKSVHNFIKDVKERGRVFSGSEVMQRLRNHSNSR